MTDAQSLLSTLGITRDQVWRLDPHRDQGSTQDVEVTGTGTRGASVVVMVRAILPGGFRHSDERPVTLKDFVRHAVLVADAGLRGEYDHADPTEPFVR